jgi:anti-sigma B factor antagonist
MSTTSVTLDVVGNSAVISAAGEIDMATAPLLIQRCGEVPGSVSHVVVDLSEVTFFDSSGLGALVACQKRHGSLTVVASKPQIVRLFEITGLKKVFHTVETLKEAMEAAEASEGP